MENKELAEIYDRFHRIADLLSKTAVQLQDQSKLMQGMQWQIVDLNKRLKVLESKANDSLKAFDHRT